MRVLLLIFIFMSLNACSGLLVYELVSSSQFIEDDHEGTPMVNVRYYYDQQPKKDKSHMYPKPKSEFKP